MKTLTLDIETTGLPPKGATYQNDYNLFPYVVTLAYKVNDQPTNYFILNQEGRTIPEDVIKIHGITNEMAQASSTIFSQAIAAMLADGIDADVVIGHNIYFDTSIIKANVLRLQDEPLRILTDTILHKDRRIDTMMKTIKFCDLKGKWPKLTELHFKLFGEDFNAHNSASDVDATYRCFVKLRELQVL